MTGIIILNYNTYDATEECISSIWKHVKAKYKIYLVDNNSKEECVKKLEEKYGSDQRIHLILLKKNLGYSGGNNEGIKLAISDGAKNILVINSDVVLLNDIVTLLGEKIDGNIALSGPKIYLPSGENGQYLRKNYSFLYALTDKKPFYYLRKIFCGLDVCYKYKNWGVGLSFRGMLSGCCFLVDAKKFEKIGYFDDNVFLYGEEYIIGKKLEALNYESYYEPKAKIVHKHGVSTAHTSKGFVTYHTYVSLYYVLKKYCKTNIISSLIIKHISIINYMIKAIRDNSYRKYLKKLYLKLEEIDSGKYKIDY
ncbi:glycosyltransferase family 2 protein [[Clostridium] symbiosum]|uniref:glycosyltransferase n=1 Tax=Clostridium symbiosum TaxID=1512 RepID=UPI001D096A0D|nr:glycosyltransferase family 2 protein [[Clostridium] symbiosum]MCB6610935.1 glycosyltransferase family 2 protein [[Clostridium] symbiosum]MCB6931619.1 glycosyltransferase family 2 protein [[Clostridium] symbiosum]